MNILLAADGSEYSDVAARFLTRCNLTPQDKIIIFHVVSEVPYEDEYHAQIKRAIRRVAPQILRSASDILKDVKAKVSVAEKEGYPDATIVRSAADAGADLIVMGARGVKGIKLFVLGSVARKVAADSPVPVLVAKRTEWDTPRKMRVLLATDGSAHSNATARLLAAMPFYPDFEVTVLNVQWSAFYDIPERFAMEVDDSMKKAVADRRQKDIETSGKILEEAKAIVSGKYENVQSLIKYGDPTSEILSAAEQLKADIIAVGCRGLKDVKGIMGSVSRNILVHSKASVLIGKTA